MSPSIASLICVCGIAGLLYLDRDKTTRVSMALWIPGIWIALVGSRPLTLWLGQTLPANAQLEGSPLDAAAFGALLATAVVVLIRRRAKAQPLLFANRTIVIYLLYCLISVAWSYYPDISLKRWIKATGDLAIVLIIATDQDPVAALRRTISRVGFFLLPTSVLFIKYYSELGRHYGAEGDLMNRGVAMNKNALGLIVLVISLVAVWNLRSLLAQKDAPDRGRRLIAQGVLLAFGLALLGMASCATCIACFVLGSCVMIATGRPVIRRRPARVHAIIFATTLVACIALLFGGHEALIEALGRESSLSGRSDIWPASIRAAASPIVGAGFEIFWLSPNVEIFRQYLLDLGYFPPLVAKLNEAHNGYIEMYLNLGWIGVCMIAAVLLVGYRDSIKVFRLDWELGSFILAIVAVAAVYSVTEAGFRPLNPMWILLLLALVTAKGVITGISRDRWNDPAASGGIRSRGAADVEDHYKRKVPKTKNSFNRRPQDRSRSSSDRIGG